MNVAIYNVLNSQFIFEEEFESIFAYILLFEKIEISSPISHELINYIEFETKSDDAVLNQLLFFRKENPTFAQDIADHKILMKEARKLKAKKNKSREELRFINSCRSVMMDCRKMLKTYLEMSLISSKLTEIIKFDEEDIWDLWLPFNITFDNNENFFIPSIVQMIIRQKYILATSEYIEKLYKHVDINQLNGDTFDFIKLPLWKFPIVSKMMFLQLKYTREDIKSGLSLFHMQLKECLTALCELSFTIENFEKISTTLRDKIISLKEPVQHAIDTSLYISQLRNKKQGDGDMTFNLGITSAETLVDYYQQTKMIEPYVASEIKDRLKRTMNLDATCVFSYVTGTKSEVEGG